MIRIPDFDVPAEPDRPAPGPATAPSHSVGEPPLVLVVDDQEYLHGILRRVLEGAGFLVMGSLEADAAMRRLRTGVPRVDLLLTCERVGDMHGVELVRRARELSPGLPAVFMSRRWGPGDEAGDGRAPLLRMPFTGRQLLTAVNRALREASHPVEERGLR
jgi:DNA-binding NtrC family response regulator